MSHIEDSFPSQMSCQEEDSCRELATEFVSGNKAAIRLGTKVIDCVTENPTGGSQSCGVAGDTSMGKSCAHFSILCRFLHRESAYGFTRDAL